jgi:serine/threonine protein phosphatase PrpC
VADGIGSYTDSGVVAQSAVGTALTAMTSGRVPLRDVWALIASSLTQRSEELAIKGATTLVLASLAPNPGGGADIELQVVGDCQAWRLSSGRWECLIAEPGDNPRALPHHAKPTSRVGHLSRGDVLLLATDGFWTALDDAHCSLASVTANSWSSPPSLLSFTNQIDFHLDGYYDDRSAIAVWIR